MKLDWVFGALFILAIVFLIAFYLSLPDQNLLIWPGVILVILLLIYLAANYKHSQGWKVVATLFLAIFLAMLVVPGTVFAIFAPYNILPVPVPVSTV